ncbi:hypothetical protein DE146DRAFT_663079 [Phaeosphaeria sp. MPI-PUGE-AT-0046c]|nr:hypothetical protein DE146DRAFT_663079 [Phaeosphaeria sp. MPI-PUGE-AT-0046c]
MSVRAQRLQGSMGSSWGDADYSTGDDTSIHTASDPDSNQDSDGLQEEQGRGEYTDTATPLLSDRKRGSVPRGQDPPNYTPTRNSTRHSQMGSSRTTSRVSSAKSTPASTEPSFIMPMDDFGNGTPTRNSQIRSRKQRQSSSRGSSFASPKVSSRRTPKATQPFEEQGELGPWYYVNMFYENLMLPILALFWDVFSYAYRHLLKPILGVLFGVGIILFGLQMASGLVYSKITTAMAPLCLLPGSSYFLPMCAHSQQGGVANFEDLIKVESRFEDILDAKSDSLGLPAAITESRLAIGDLRTLVRHSHLPSRSQLDVEFKDFLETARQASFELTRYNSHIEGMMQRVIGTNAWTLQVLQDIQYEDASIGVVGRVFNAATGAFLSPAPTLQQRIYDQYVLHVGKNRDEIEELITKAQALLAILTNLDERLDTINDLAVRDDTTITKRQDDLLSHLWTKLGGNSASVKSGNRHLNLLRNVYSYRRRALKHVTETLLKLQEIQAELENLHTSVSGPETLGSRSNLPITFYIDSIEHGVERLRSAKGQSDRIESAYNKKLLGGSAASEDVKELPGARTTSITLDSR